MAGTKPHSLTSDVGPEWSGDFARMLDSKGIISFQKRPEDKNAIATLDVAIGQLKKQLVRDTRRLGTNDWASRLQKVTDGKNQNPIEDYLEGQAPAGVKENKDLIFSLKKKNALYADFNQARIKKRAKALEEAGQFRPEETNKQGIRARRGFKPTYGDLKNVKEVQNAEVIDQAGKII